MPVRLNTATSIIRIPSLSLSEYTIHIDGIFTANGENRVLASCFNKGRSFLVIDGENNELGFDTRNNFVSTGKVIPDTRTRITITASNNEADFYVDGILVATTQNMFLMTDSNLTAIGGGYSGGLAPSNFLAPSNNLAPSSPVQTSCNGDIFQALVFATRLTPAEIRGLAVMSSPAQDYAQGDWHFDNIISDNTIDAAEKQMVLDWWNGINGNGVTSGSYWTSRANLVAANVSTATLDTAFTTLRTYLVSNTILDMTAPNYQPAIIRTPSTIVASEWKLVWETYWSAEANVSELIGEAKKVEAVEEAAAEATDIVETAIPVLTPRYLGIGDLSALSTATFTGATVDEDGVITVGSAIVPNVGDWMVHYDNTGSVTTLGIYVWSSTAWSLTTLTRYIDSCATDIYNLGTGGILVNGYTVLVNALIKNLFAQFIKIQTGGSIRGGDRYDEDGETIDGTKPGFFISATGACKVAGIEFEGSQGGGVQWGGGIKVNNGITISGAVFSALAYIDNDLVVFIDSGNQDLRAYKNTGNSFVLSGSELNIPNVDYPALAAISKTDVILASTTLNQLRRYRFNGSAFSQIGSSFSLTMNTPSMAALNSTDVAFIAESPNQLRCYTNNGTSFSQKGNSLTISGLSYPSITALTETRVAVSDSGTATLRIYDFDGTNWTLVGTPYDNQITNPDAISQINALNGTDVVFADTEGDTLYVVRFNGSTWSRIASAGSIESGGGHISMDSVNGSDIIVFGNSNLRSYRFAFALSVPYRPWN